MKYFKKINGNNIYLSPVNPDDYELSTKWMNDRQVTESLGIYDKLYSLNKEKKGLEDSSLEDYSFAIVKKADDQLIGFCAFHYVNIIHQRAELYIYIGEEENRGKGYGEDALNALLQYGFGTLNFNSIMLRVFSSNQKAIKCYEKVGFNIMGIRREAFYSNFAFLDEIYMDIIKKDYIRKKSLG